MAFYRNTLHHCTMHTNSVWSFSSDAKIKRGIINCEKNDKIRALIADCIGERKELEMLRKTEWKREDEKGTEENWSVTSYFELSWSFLMGVIEFQNLISFFSLFPCFFSFLLFPRLEKNQITYIFFLCFKEFLGFCNVNFESFVVLNHLSLHFLKIYPEFPSSKHDKYNPHELISPETDWLIATVWNRKKSLSGTVCLFAVFIYLNTFLLLLLLWIYQKLLWSTSIAQVGGGKNKYGIYIFFIFIFSQRCSCTCCSLKEWTSNLINSTS